MKELLRYTVTVCFICSCSSAFSNAYAEADKAIQQLYHRLDANPTPMPSRLDQISGYFLEKPYEGNALGEGNDATYDQGPIYRTDSFDCETYVDTVVAIALSPDFHHFPQCIKRIRYHNSEVSFTTRNHFASLDWNKHNQEVGIFKDITETIKDENGKPIALMAEAFINKPEWYRQLPKERIRLPNASTDKQTKQLRSLRREGKHQKAEVARIAYIPLTALFNEKGHANQQLFDQIPDGAIIEIIRPNWNLSTRIGSHLNVSHMGFAFRNNGDLRFRHASIVHKKVSDVSLVNYLRAARKSPTIRGINVQVVVPDGPAVKNCS